jgi:hypothetical protein
MTTRCRNISLGRTSGKFALPEFPDYAAVATAAAAAAGGDECSAVSNTKDSREWQHWQVVESLKEESEVVRELSRPSAQLRAHVIASPPHA